MMGMLKYFEYKMLKYCERGLLFSTSILFPLPVIENTMLK